MMFLKGFTGILRQQRILHMVLRFTPKVDWLLPSILYESRFVINTLSSDLTTFNRTLSKMQLQTLAPPLGP
jgi:hypothetical protein